MSGAFKGPHLRELVRLPVRGDRCAVHGNHLIVGSHGAMAPHELTTIDIANPASPKVKSRIRFKYRMPAVTLVGNLVYVFEDERAIHLVRLDKGKPTIFDCHLMFGQDLPEMATLGARFLVAARGRAGVSVFDVSDPAQPVETDVRALGSRSVESLLVVGQRVFAAAGADGLVELRADSDGKLVETGRWFGGDKGFEVERVFAIDGRLWIFGEGTLPYEPQPVDGGRDDDDTYEEYGKYREHDEDDDVAPEPNTVILSLDDVGGAPIWVGTNPIRPKQLRPVPGGGAIALHGYRCWRFPSAGKAELLFKRHEKVPEAGAKKPRTYVEVAGGATGRGRFELTSDAACWLRLGKHLMVQQPDELVIYAIHPKSPLATMAEG